MINAGLENGRGFNLDPGTMRMFGELLAASIDIDNGNGRPSEAELAEHFPMEVAKRLRRFWDALDALGAWKHVPAEKPKPQILGLDGEPIQTAHARRRQMAGLN